MSRIFKSVSMRELPRVIHTTMPAALLDEPVVDNRPSQDELRLKAEAVLDEARKQASAILAQAKAQAAGIAAEAEEKGRLLAAEAKENGYTEGYDNGYAEGKQAIEDQMQKTLTDAVEKGQEILQLAERQARESVVAAEGKVVELALAVAQKILARELENTAEVILPIAKKALEKVRDQEQVVIRVNAADYEAVLQNRRDLQMILGQEQALTIAHDQTIEAGSCMIESANGTVDARVSTQFEVLEKTLQDLVP